MVKVSGFNSYYVGILMNLANSSEGLRISELQFDYFSSVLKPFVLDLGQFFEVLGLEDREMALSISGSVSMFGGDAVYTNSKGVFLSGRRVDFVKDVNQMFLLAVEIKEKQSIDIRNAIGKIDNKEIKNGLEEILKKVYSQIEKIKNKYKNTLNFK